MFSESTRNISDLTQLLQEVTKSEGRISSNVNIIPSSEGSNSCTEEIKVPLSYVLSAKPLITFLVSFH